MRKDKEEDKKYKHQWYLDNQERILRERKKKYEENRDEILKTQYDYREKHRKELSAKQREYYRQNREKCDEKNKAHRQSPAKYDIWFEKMKLFYGDDEIRQDPKNPELIQFRCFYHECREWFNPTNQQLADRYKALNGTIGQANLYCSDECKQCCSVFNQKKYPKGMNPNKYSREVQPELRVMVLARDNYTCQREGCNKSLKDYPDLVLHCHHKFPLNEDPICSADIDNCITLCEECHLWVHTHVPGCTNAELRC